MLSSEPLIGLPALTPSPMPASLAAAQYTEAADGMIGGLYDVNFDELSAMSPIATTMPAFSSSDQLAPTLGADPGCVDLLDAWAAKAVFSATPEDYYSIDCLLDQSMCMGIADMSDDVIVPTSDTSLIPTADFKMMGTGDIDGASDNSYGGGVAVVPHSFQEPTLDLDATRIRSAPTLSPPHMAGCTIVGTTVTTSVHTAPHSLNATRGAGRTASIQELQIIGNPAWPALRKLIMQVREALLGFTTGSPHLPTDEEDILIDADIFPDLDPALSQQNSEAQEVQDFVLQGIGIYRALLKHIVDGHKQEEKEWSSCQSKLQAQLDLCIAKNEPGPPMRAPPPRRGAYSSTRSGAGQAHGEQTAASPYRRSRATLPKKATTCLKDWLFNHEHHPYPDDDEKDDLILQTGLTVSQINNWFINARRRVLPVRPHASP
jgi:hypothetical protein